MDPKQNLLLLLEYPLLLPQNKECTIFDGFIQVAGEEFRLYIHLRNPPSVKGIVIFCPLNLRSFLSTCRSNIIEWETGGISLVEFLRRLQNLIAVGIQHGKISKSISSSCISNHQKSIEFYSWIIEELRTLELQEEIFLESPSGELNEIQLRFVNEDSFGRMHTAFLKFESVTLSASVLADLPSQVEFVPQKGMSVRQIYKKYVSIVESLQEFWNIMDCIDQKCWVIDPEHPKRKDTYRRIMLGTNISMYINIDPLDLYKRPDITFIGSERTILPFKNSLEENLEVSLNICAE
ncbi:hypothetical protein J437_LFUL001396 [Ladona fulva]|uniref:Uncharacterized protein n=1 Tax=Ladona fulva TaxID=123851 RepID=A0A8K0K1W0_LADFU|nr:hypothetical protein J437_LFUL001396 [Ladona fulva]